MTLGGNTEDANMRYANHPTQQSAKWNAVTGVEQGKHSTRQREAIHPRQARLGSLSLTSTVLALASGVHYKLLLENRSLWAFQHDHHLNKEAPARRGEGSR